MSEELKRWAWTKSGMLSEVGQTPDAKYAWTKFTTARQSIERLEGENLELRQDKLKVAEEQYENVKKFVDLATEDTKLLLKESMDREVVLEGRLEAVKVLVDDRKKVTHIGSCAFYTMDFQTADRILSDTRPALAVVEGLVFADKFLKGSYFNYDRLAVWRASACEHPDYKLVKVIVLHGGDSHD